MLDELSDRTRYGLAAAFALSIVASFGAGAVLSGSEAPVPGGESSENEIRQTAESITSQQVQRQRQQLQQVANQSENLSMEDLSIDSSVESVSRSRFDSLYRVNVSMTGEVPNRLGSGTRSLDQVQTLYISEDGRYLFQEPTDLEQQRTQQPTAGQ